MQAGVERLKNPVSDCCGQAPFNPLGDDGLGQCGWCLFWLEKDEWIEEGDAEKAGVDSNGREWTSLCERSHRAIRDFKNNYNKGK